MGSRGVQAGGLGRYRHFQGFDVEPAGPLAHPVLVDGLDAVGVVSAGRYRWDSAIIRLALPRVRNIDKE